LLVATPIFIEESRELILECGMLMSVLQQLGIELEQYDSTMTAQTISALFTHNGPQLSAPRALRMHVHQRLYVPLTLLSHRLAASLRTHLLSKYELLASVANVFMFATCRPLDVRSLSLKRPTSIAIQQHPLLHQPDTFWQLVVALANQDWRMAQAHIDAIDQTIVRDAFQASTSTSTPTLASISFVAGQPPPGFNGTKTGTLSRVDA
jgi:hypothetical protein